ncbi:dinucleotide-utilizing enzyme [Microbacterium sp. NPDC056044]|uniref:dinucleotide-utilizing enzyme n=1 Tax=Microbacterium sp. NPDC056044 TaxID=3345690 RepID=UPI0035E11A74
MSTRPRLTRSIPFWGLVAVSAATIAGGWYITTDKLGTMTTTLTDGSATGVDVYVGQSIAQLGSILIGAGVIGILLALGVAALSTLRPHPPVEVVEPIDWSSEAETALEAPEAPKATTDAAPAAAEEPADAEAEAGPTRPEAPRDASAARGEGVGTVAAR